MADSTLDDSASAIAMSSTRTADTHMTKDSIRAFLIDFCIDAKTLYDKPKECWEAFYEKTHHPEYTHIRNSGNALTSQEFIDMLTGGVLVGTDLQLVSIDKIVLMAGGRSAVVTYTIDQHFEYKGVPNSDRCVYTLVLEEVDGEPKMVQEQRSNGMPIPKPKSRWQTNADTEGHHNHIVDYVNDDDSGKTHGETIKSNDHNSHNTPKPTNDQVTHHHHNNSHTQPPKKPSTRRRSGTSLVSLHEEADDAPAATDPSNHMTIPPTPPKNSFTLVPTPETSSSSSTEKHHQRQSTTRTTKEEPTSPNHPTPKKANRETKRTSSSCTSSSPTHRHRNILRGNDKVKPLPSRWNS
ncbi:expressed unknown protein [Seminavis robusta]|uniref:NTF2 domain-containing protein n=1 Tax=Seminavis robusta TaxID=568900 RepID=A0A9N8EEP2_9STRA|nr:expressed unknown protein [Seminavis robusta]|eukprot:Sro831_g208300.1 n/a (351) ;mRNA; f:8045-9097